MRPPKRDWRANSSSTCVRVRRVPEALPDADLVVPLALKQGRNR